MTSRNIGCRWGLAGVLLFTQVLGCSRFNCSKSSRPQPVAPDAASPPIERLTVNPAASDASAPAWLTALRERRWLDAQTALASSDMGLANKPPLRFAYAYVLAKTQQFADAWSLLQDLEKELPELTFPIARLRAEVALHTQQAATGAAWLTSQGEPQAYVRAAQTQLQAKSIDLALASATRAVDLLTPLHDDASRDALAEARALRAQVRMQRGEAQLAAPDWLWLATQVPTHPAAQGADSLWEQAIGQKLTVDQRLTRAAALAKAGMLEATESELEKLQAVPHAPLAAGYSDWLLGKARSRARVDHLQGARMLERSIAAHVEDADSLRMEAARLYLRAGKETETLRMMEIITRSKSPRSREAQGLAARAHGIMGNFPAALRIYDSLLGKDKPKNKDDVTFEQAVTAVLAGQPLRGLKALDVIAQNERRESLRARAAELAAVAALEAQRKDEAISRFRSVVAQYPFTLGAWLASERLAQLQVTPVLSPLPTQDAPKSGATTVEFPKAVATLYELGLVDLASSALAKEESSMRHRLGQAAAELMCNAYGAIGTAERRYAWSREAIGNLDLNKLPDTSTRWRWDCRFPQPYPGIADALQKQWSLPPGLVYAVMRQESSFREKIRSPMGAVGLTQMLPQTAKRLLKALGDVSQCNDANLPRLDEPRCNMELGARYLHWLLEIFDNQLPLVVLSYNAGPELVNRWVSAKKPMPLDLFLAEVPIPETRNYVHHVLTNFLVYAWLVPQRQPLPRLEMTPTATTKSNEDLY